MAGKDNVDADTELPLYEIHTAHATRAFRLLVVVEIYTSLVSCHKSTRDVLR